MKLLYLSILEYFIYSCKLRATCVFLCLQSFHKTLVHITTLCIGHFIHFAYHMHFSNFSTNLESICTIILCTYRVKKFGQFRDEVPPGSFRHLFHVKFNSDNVFKLKNQALRFSCIQFFVNSPWLEFVGLWVIDLRCCIQTSIRGMRHPVRRTVKS